MYQFAGEILLHIHEIIREVGEREWITTNYQGFAKTRDT